MTNPLIYLHTHTVFLHNHTVTYMAPLTKLLFCVKCRLFPSECLHSL